VHRTSKDAPAKVHVGASIDQSKSCLKVLLTDREAQGRAAVLVVKVGVRLVHEEPLNHSSVAHDRCFVQGRSLSVVPLVFIKVIVTEVLEEGDEGTFAHLVLQQQVTKHH